MHHDRTPLHLAFSCYLLDAQGRVLLTRRALTKTTWPGVWTNACCGHPAPGEAHADAVRRRVRQELGVGIDDLRLVLPAFRYRAVMDDGVEENELCPVYVGRVVGELDPDPSEVAGVAWASWADVRREVADGTSPLSPWALTQIDALPADLRDATDRPVHELPPAARPPA